MRSRIDLSTRLMRRKTTVPRVGAFSMLVLLLFAIPAQADEIEPEPEPAPIERAEPAPEPEPEPDPEPEPAMVSEDEDEEDDDEGYARSGFYLGASMTGAWYSEIKDEVRDGLNAITPPNQQVPRVHMEQPFGIRLRTGYRFLPRLAAEVQFTWYSNAIIELDDGQQNTLDAVKVETLALSGNLKGYLLTGRVQPFVSAGGGLLHANTSDNKLNLGVKNDGDAFAGRFGGGVDLYINPNFVAVVEGGYVLPTGKLDKLDHVTWAVGLVYRF